MTTAHLSPQAHQRLVEELEERRTVRRREISTWIERAREHGDLRENADYDAAKNEQGHNEARIRHLEALLDNAEVVESADDADVVAPGVVVEVRINDAEDTQEFLLGSIEERPDDLDVLSTNSPLGQAIIGAGPGETRTYEGPKGTLTVEVVGVRPAA